MKIADAIHFYWFYSIANAKLLLNSMLNGVRPDSNANCCNAERVFNFGNVNA